MWVKRIRWCGVLSGLDIEFHQTLDRIIGGFGQKDSLGPAGYTIPYRKDDVPMMGLYVMECTRFAAASADVVFGWMTEFLSKD